MNIDYERTIDDIIEANLFHASHSPSIKKQLLFARIVITVFIILTALTVSYIEENRFTLFSLILSIFAGVLIFALYPRMNHKASIRRLKKLLNEGNNKAMLGHQIISLTPECIYSKTQAGESKINWLTINKVMQNDKYVFLYTSSINALVIPKTAFPSEREQEFFLEYINIHSNHN